MLSSFQFFFTLSFSLFHNSSIKWLLASLFSFQSSLHLSLTTGSWIKSDRRLTSSRILLTFTSSVVSSFFLQDYISFIFSLVFFFVVFFFGVVVFLSSWQSPFVWNLETRKCLPERRVERWNQEKWISEVLKFKKYKFQFSFTFSKVWFLQEIFLVFSIFTFFQLQELFFCAFHILCIFQRNDFTFR